MTQECERCNWILDATTRLVATKLAFKSNNGWRSDKIMAELRKDVREAEAELDKAVQALLDEAITIGKEPHTQPDTQEADSV